MIDKLINERYKVIDKLGGSGMSIVYLAEDLILKRKVAIKAISIPREKRKKHCVDLKEKFIIHHN